MSCKCGPRGCSDTAGLRPARADENDSRRYAVSATAQLELQNLRPGVWSLHIEEQPSGVTVVVKMAATAGEAVQLPTDDAVGGAARTFPATAIETIEIESRDQLLAIYLSPSTASAANIWLTRTGSCPPRSC